MINDHHKRPIFIGYDSREPEAYTVCARSILHHAFGKVDIFPLKSDHLRRLGIYRRASYMDEDQLWEDQRGEQHSTEFTFTRYLVPALMNWRGWALFCDGDFLFRESVSDVFGMADDRYAVMCCRRPSYRPVDTSKMFGQRVAQNQYERKNWSSFVLWNCSHPANQELTPYRVNHSRKSFLHGFAWLEDDEIGALPMEWNWLEGEGDEGEPKAVHFTRGIPSLPGYEKSEYSDEWFAYLHGAR